MGEFVNISSTASNILHTDADDANIIQRLVRLCVRLNIRYLLHHIHALDDTPKYSVLVI